MTIDKLELPTLDEDSAIEAIETVGSVADENNIEWALVGGLALILYGSDRLTTDEAAACGTTGGKPNDW